MDVLLLNQKDSKAYYFNGSGIDVRQGITVGPGKFVEKNKRRALNKRRHEQNVQIYVTKNPLNL